MTQALLLFPDLTITIIDIHDLSLKCKYGCKRQTIFQISFWIISYTFLLVLAWQKILKEDKARDRVEMIV